MDKGYKDTGHFFNMICQNCQTFQRAAPKWWVFPIKQRLKESGKASLTEGVDTQDRKLDLSDL